MDYQKTTFYLHKKYETVDITNEDLNYLNKVFKRQICKFKIN